LQNFRYFLSKTLVRSSRCNNQLLAGGLLNSQ